MANLRVRDLRGRVRERPCSSHWLRQIWSDYRANQGSTASHGLPRPLTFGLPTASHCLGLPQFVMWSVWANQGARLSRTRPLTHTASQISQICDDLWGRGRPICEARKSEVPIGLSQGSHPRARLTDFTAKQLRPLESDVGLSNLWGRSDSQIWEADLRPWEADRTVWQITWLSTERPCSASHGLTIFCLRGRSASQMSQIWESDRPHRPHRFESPICDRSDSLRLSDRSDRSDRSDVP